MCLLPKAIDTSSKNHVSPIQKQSESKGRKMNRHQYEAKLNAKKPAPEAEKKSLPRKNSKPQQNADYKSPNQAADK